MDMKKVLVMIFLFSVFMLVSCDSGTEVSSDGDDDTGETNDADAENGADQTDEADDAGDAGDVDETDDVDETGDTFNRQWGTSSYDVGNSIAVDSSGNIYVAGITYGSLDGNTNAGSGDIFLTKWNSNGKKQWTKQWGTRNNDSGQSVAVDSSGNVFVTGTAGGSLNGYEDTGETDIFLTKFDNDGRKMWTSQWWGTDQLESGYFVKVDTSGNIFVTGFTNGDLDGNGNAGETDVFIAKLDDDGNHQQWIKQWGTSSNDDGNSIAFDNSGNIFVAGTTWGSLDGNTNAGDDSTDPFLTKFDNDGNKLWTKQWGTFYEDSGSSVAVDSAGNIFVTGGTWENLDGNESAGESDIFLTKFDNDGNKLWTRQFGTFYEDYGRSIVIDGSDNIFITGYTYGFFEGNEHADESDVFLAKFDNDGNKLWTKKWQGTDGWDEAYSVAVDNEGNIFITGFTRGSFDGYTNAGESDIFLTKTDNDGNSFIF